jgi:hypothetical protein
MQSSAGKCVVDNPAFPLRVDFLSAGASLLLRRTRMASKGFQPRS